MPSTVLGQDGSCVGRFPTAQMPIVRVANAAAISILRDQRILLPLSWPILPRTQSPDPCYCFPSWEPGPASLPSR